MSIFEKLTALPINHPEFLHDWNKRYQNTFMLLNGKPIHIKERLDYEVTYQEVGKRINEIFDLKSKQDINLEVWLPENGYYGNEDYPLITLVCNPTRQWKRSYCTILYKDISGIRYPLQNSTSYLKFLDAIVNPVYQTKPDRYQDDTYMRVHQNLLFWKQAVMYKGLKIGAVDYDAKQITLSIPYLHQEVQDILRKQGLSTSWNLQ